MMQGAGIVSVLFFRALYRVLRGSLAGERKLVLGPVSPEPDVTASGSMRLSVEDGMESWLDLETGAITTVPVKSEAVSAPSAMMAVVCAALDEYEIPYLRTNATSIVLHRREEHGRYVVLYTVSDADRLVHAWTAFGAHVPELARTRVRGLIEHINPHIPAGHLELDDEDGDVYVRVRFTPSEADLTPLMARQAMYTVLTVAEEYHAIIMRVAFGGLTVEEAIAEGEIW
jgi:hypothetical protein